MIKRLCLALAGLFCIVSLAQGAGTVPGFSLTPQFDLSGHVAPGCRLYVIQAGTTGTPQNAYQDSGLSILQPNPMICDAGGRLSQFFVADGVIKLRLTTSTGAQIFVGDNLLVVGASGGGGGGGTVDPTTILQTGDFKQAYGTGILTGFVRANGRTIGSATSGATERANADTQALFVFLWAADPNLSVSGGRGASAAADFAANKTIALPDVRGRVLAGLDGMGAPSASRMSGAIGASDTLGSVGGVSTVALSTANLPPYTPSGSITNGAISATNVIFSSIANGGQNAISTSSTGTAGGNLTTALGLSQATSTFTGTAQGGTSTPFALVQPTILATIYIKL